jgi:hypothetical protein
MLCGVYTRFLFAYLVPGASLVCTILFLVNVPVEDGYRISLLEWSLESDRVFPYLIALGLVASAVLGSLAQAVRTLLVDRWALHRAMAAPGRSSMASQPEHGEGLPTDPPPAVAPPRDALPARRRAPGPLTELHGNLAIAVLVATLWSALKIVRGGGTEVFPRGIAYGVPLAGLAAAALLFALYRRFPAGPEE